MPQLSETWIGANFTAPEDRSEAQTHELGLSDQLIAEVEKADVLLIGLPIYIVLAVTIMNWLDRPPLLVELGVYIGLGVLWAFPFRAVFRGVGQAPNPDED